LIDFKQVSTGQYNNPSRVVAFNTAEHWSQDVSIDVARELRRRCPGQRYPVFPSGFRRSLRSGLRQIFANSLGIRVDGVVGVLGTSGPNGTVEGFIGKHSGMV
jgi:hypothetical protein